MKKGWEVKRLGDVVSFQRGLTYSKKDEVDFSSNIVLRANNVDLRTNALDFSELKYINDDLTIPKEKKVTKGSLIICTASGSKSHLGKIALIDDDYEYAFGGFMGQLNPSNNIDSKYLFHLLTSDAYKTFVNKLSDGVNINNLRFDDLSAFPIPLPPLPEQKRIVGILDKVFAAISTAKANAEKNLQNARELFESYLQSVFANPGDGWEEKTLGDSSILEIIDGDRGVNYPKKPDFFEKGYCLFLNTKNVRPDGFSFDATTFISKEKDSVLRKGKLMRNDVILTTRGTIGNIAVYDGEVPYDNVRINSGMLIFRPNIKKLLPSFLFEVLRSGIIKTQIARHVSGAAQPQLPIKTLVNFKIPVPRTVDVQAKIVISLKEIATNTKRLKVIYQQKLNDLEELKKSVLHKAFNGELAGACS